MVAALIKFDQGPNSDIAGRAVSGTTTDGVVTVSNGDDTGVVSWKFEVLYVPPGSALPLTVQGPTGVATFTFTPDVAGSYRIRLTVFDAGSSSEEDIRNFCVPFTNGVIAPPYQRNPSPIPLTGLGGKPDEMNIGGQAFGWDGEDAPGAFLMFQVLQLVDGLSTGGEANTASNIGGGSGLFKVKTGVNLEFRTLVAGTNVTITPIGDTFEIAASAAGEANLGANVGASGEDVFRDKTGVTLNFKRLVAGTNITLTPAADTLTIGASVSGETNLAANVGGGDGWFRDKTGVTLNFKTAISTDSSVTVTPAADTLDLEVTEPAGTAGKSLSFSHSSTFPINATPKSPVWNITFHPSVDTAFFTYPTSGSISANEVKVLVKGMYRLHAEASVLLTSGSYFNPGISFYNGGVEIAGSQSSTAGDDCTNIQHFSSTVEVDLAVDDVVTPGFYRFSGSQELIGNRTHFTIDFVRVTA